MALGRRTEGKPTGILVADDRPKVRSALRLLLEQEPGLKVVAEASEAEGLFGQVLELEPDLVLLDWELPDSVGCCPERGLCASYVTALRSLYPSLGIVVMSGRPEARSAALAAGADAFASKGDPPERFMKTLHVVLDGGKKCTTGG